MATAPLQSCHVVFDPKVEGGIDIAFFHGLQFHEWKTAWRETWTTTTDCCWIEEWLPHNLKKELNVDARILSLSYDSGTLKSRSTGNHDSVEEIARDLLAGVVANRDYALGNIPFFLVGHSLGGLVIKSLVVEANREAATRTNDDTCTIARLRVERANGFMNNLRGIVFYAVPHGGVESAAMIERWKGWLGVEGSESRIVGELTPFNLRMAVLSSDFEAALKTRRVNLAALVEGQEMPGVGFVVPKASAMAGVGGTYTTVPCNHLEITKPIDATDDRYKILLSFIADVLSPQQVPACQQLKDLRGALKLPIYLDQTDALLKYFVPGSREWVLDRFRNWQRLDPGHEGFRTLLIHGNPGIGKSTIAAVMVKRRQVHVHHFCRFNVQSMANPLTMMKNIAFQLAQQLPLYRTKLLAVAEELKTSTEVEDVLRLLLDPLREMPGDQPPLIVLVDALDEVDDEHATGASKLQPILSQLTNLPTWVRFIFTSRPERHIRALMGTRFGEPFVIKADGEEHLEDLHQYLRVMVLQGLPASDIETFTSELEAAVNEVMVKSEGSFVYVAQLRSMLAGKLANQTVQDVPSRLQVLSRLPHGLFGIYQEYFQKHGSDLDPSTRILLEVLVATRQPPSLVQLESWLCQWLRDHPFQPQGWLCLLLMGRPLQQAMEEQLGTLFEVRQGSIYPFHKTVYDWLTDSEKNPIFWVSRDKGHILLASFVSREQTSDAPPTSWSSYMVRHGLAHYSLAIPGLKTATPQRTALVTSFKALLGNMHFWQHAAAKVALDGLLVDLQQLGPPMDEVRDVVRWLRRDFAVMQQSDLDVAMAPQLAVAQLAWTTPQGSFTNKRAADYIRQQEGAGGVPRHLTPPQRWDPLLAELHAPHGAVVVHLAFLRATTTVVTVSEGVTMRLWDARTGTPLTELRPPSGPLSSTALSSDGARLALAFQDGLVQVWDVRASALVAERRHCDVWRLALSQDGTVLASASSHDVWIWDLARRSVKRAALQGPTVAVSVNFFSLSPKGDLLAFTFSFAGYAWLWDGIDGSQLHKLSGHTSLITCVAFSPDSRVLATGAFDCTVQLWDTEKRIRVAVLEGHSGPIAMLAFSPDGTLLASASWDTTVRLWSIGEHKQAVRGAQPGARTAPKVLEGHTWGIYAIAFSADGRMLASGSGDHTARLWDVQTGVLLAELKGHRNQLRSVAFASDGALLASVDELDHSVRLWDAQFRTSSAARPGHSGAVTCMTFSPDGSKLATASEDATVGLWDAQEHTMLAQLPGHTGRVNSVAFSPNGALLASASNDQTVLLWAVNSPKPERRHTLTGHGFWVTYLAFSPDNRMLASVAGDNSCRLESVPEGAQQPLLIASCQRRRDGHKVSSSQTRLHAGETLTDERLQDIWKAQKPRSPQQHRSNHSPDPDTLGYQCADLSNVLSNGDKGSQLISPAAYFREGWGLMSVAFSPKTSSAVVLALSHHNHYIETDVVQLLTVDNGATTEKQLVGEAATVPGRKTMEAIGKPYDYGQLAQSDVAFSPDGELLAMASRFRIVWLWRVSTGYRLAALCGHTAAVNHVKFSPDGSMLASSSNDGTVRLWRVADHTAAASPISGDSFVFSGDGIFIIKRRRVSYFKLSALDQPPHAWFCIESTHSPAAIAWTPGKLAVGAASGAIEWFDVSGLGA